MANESCPSHDELAKRVDAVDTRSQEMAKHVAVIADNSGKMYEAVQFLSKTIRENEKQQTLMQAEQQQQRKELEILFQNTKDTSALLSSSVRGLEEQINDARGAATVRADDLEFKRIKPLEDQHLVEKGFLSAIKDIRVWIVAGGAFVAIVAVEAFKYYLRTKGMGG